MRQYFDVAKLTYIFHFTKFCANDLIACLKIKGKLKGIRGRGPGAGLFLKRGSIAVYVTAPRMDFIRK